MNRKYTQTMDLSIGYLLNKKLIIFLEIFFSFSMFFLFLKLFLFVFVLLKITDV